jgi:hypothetical protein
MPRGSACGGHWRTRQTTYCCFSSHILTGRPLLGSRRRCPGCRAHEHTRYCKKRPNGWKRHILCTIGRKRCDPKTCCWCPPAATARQRSVQLGVQHELGTRHLGTPSDIPTHVVCRRRGEVLCAGLQAYASATEARHDTGASGRRGRGGRERSAGLQPGGRGGGRRGERGIRRLLDETWTQVYKANSPSCLFGRGDLRAALDGAMALGRSREIGRAAATHQRTGG